MSNTLTTTSPEVTRLASDAGEGVYASAPVISSGGEFYHYRTAWWDTNPEVAPTTRLYATIWEDAIDENLERSQVAPVTPPAMSITFTPDEITDFGLTSHEKTAKLRKLVEDRNSARADVARLNSEVSGLRTEQITDGGDYRLTTFWENAMEKATEENFCSEYDRMAEALGGPRRATPGHVHVTVSLEIQLPVDDVNDFEGDDDEAREYFVQSLRDGEGSFEYGNTCTD